jgi:hypothetical protein
LHKKREKYKLRRINKIRNLMRKNYSKKIEKKRKNNLEKITKEMN